jgi:hypothetical protein
MIMKTTVSLVLVATSVSVLAAVGFLPDLSPGIDTIANMDGLVHVSNVSGLDEGESRCVDLAICLDTSGSMRELLQSARQKLWTVVNELTAVRPRPKLRVALYQYGGDKLAPENGWVQQLCPLTDDLDMVYEKLFELHSGGSTEYVARVMHAATNDLKWSKSRSALRIIFIAGNEAATQDKAYKLRDTCKAAATAGILVNTVFCGNEVEGRNSGWSDAAAWADGRYAAIDQHGGTIAVQTVYDEELAALSKKLSETYVSFGAGGKSRADRQKKQDDNARDLNTAAAAERATAKASFLYDNAGWDLIDAARKKSFDITKVEKRHLPVVMQEMGKDEQLKYIDTQTRNRANIQQQIQVLSVKRKAAVKARNAGSGAGAPSLDSALNGMIRTQVVENNFKLAE